MGQIGVDLKGEIEQGDRESTLVKVDFTKSPNQVWVDGTKLNKKQNPNLKLENGDSQGELVYSLDQIPKSTLLFEYMLNPKLITLIPVSIQHRHKIVDSTLVIQLFIHVNPNLPTPISDLAFHMVMKFKLKLNKSTGLEAAQSPDGQIITMKGEEMVADQKLMIELEFDIGDQMQML